MSEQEKALQEDSDSSEDDEQSEEEEASEESSEDDALHIDESSDDADKSTYVGVMLTTYSHVSSSSTFF